METESGKQIVAGQAIGQSLLMKDYTQDVINLNKAVDRVQQVRSDAQEDINWWETAIGIGSGVIGGIIGFAAGGPPGAAVGAKAGWEFGTAVGGHGADYFIEGDERTLYDEIDKRDYLFGFDEMAVYEADFERMNYLDEQADLNRSIGAVFNIGETIATGPWDDVDVAEGDLIDSPIPQTYYDPPSDFA